MRVEKEIKIGEYWITDYTEKNRGFWIENQLGEGMEVSKEMLVALIDKFWKKHF